MELLRSDVRFYFFYEKTEFMRSSLLKRFADLSALSPPIHQDAHKNGPFGKNDFFLCVKWPFVLGVGPPRNSRKTRTPRIKEEKQRSLGTVRGTDGHKTHTPKLFVVSRVSLLLCARYSRECHPLSQF